MNKIIVAGICLLISFSPIPAKEQTPNNISGFVSYINTIEVDNTKEIELKKEGVRVLHGDLQGQEELFYSSFSNRDIGKAVVAVMCAESGCGTHKCGDYNYSGIMKNGKCQNFLNVSDYIENGVKKRTGLYFNKLDQCGYTADCANKIFIGSYCQSGCEHWVSNFMYYLEIQG